MWGTEWAEVTSAKPLHEPILVVYRSEKVKQIYCGDKEFFGPT